MGATAQVGLLVSITASATVGYSNGWATSSGFTCWLPQAEAALVQVEAR
jgi:hypothetical protein